MNFEKPKDKGLIMAARYAFMPNKLRYCGGDNNSEIFNYVTHHTSDNGLKELLEEFATMFPYLKLIADANKIVDPFNERVVEAYWIGNDLLKNVDMNDFYRHMLDKQQLKKKLPPKLLEKIFGKIPLGAKPHHSWHVLNISRQTGQYSMDYVLKTIEKCRIGWGRIKEIKKQSTGLVSTVIITHKPIEISDNKFVLGNEIDQEVWLEFNKQSFVDQIKIGDFVSVHWDWVCDFLTKEQVVNLNKWTIHNLNLVNQ